MGDRTVQPLTKSSVKPMAFVTKRLDTPGGTPVTQSSDHDGRILMTSWYDSDGWWICIPRDELGATNAVSRDFPQGRRGYW